MSVKGNAVLEAILARRSIRAYHHTPIDDSTVRAMLDAAMAAPSAAAKDPWRFVVLRKKETLWELASGLPNGKMLALAGVGFVVCGELSATIDGLLSYLLQDCSAAIENLLLAAHGLGLGAVWLGVHPREDRMAHVRKVLALPESIVPVACIAAGYPDERKDPRTRYRDEFVHWEKW